jgi:hypothetical protein
LPRVFFSKVPKVSGDTTGDSLRIPERTKTSMIILVCVTAVWVASVALVEIAHRLLNRRAKGRDASPPDPALSDAKAS